MVAPPPSPHVRVSAAKAVGADAIAAAAAPTAKTVVMKRCLLLMTFSVFYGVLCLPFSS
jgi:hypothetical protein